MKASSVIKKIYELFENDKCDKVKDILYYNFNIWANSGLYYEIDSVIYGIDLDKINSTIIFHLANESYPYRENLRMRNGFIDICKEKYPHIRVY